MKLIKWYHKVFTLSVAVAILCSPMAARPQQKKPAHRVTTVPTLLGTIAAEQIQALNKTEFVNAAQKGVVTADGQGRVTDFFVTIFTHNLYEDSLSNPVILTDVLTYFNEGPNFETSLQNYFQTSLKQGDTIFIDRIKIRAPNEQQQNGSPLNFVITN